jgi:hypothetical protein
MHPRITTTRQGLQRTLRRQLGILSKAQLALDAFEVKHRDLIAVWAEGTMGALEVAREERAVWHDLRRTAERAQWAVERAEAQLTELPAVAPDEIQTGDRVLDALLAGALTRVGKRQRFHTLYVYRRLAEGYCPYASDDAVREFERVLDMYAERPPVQVYSSAANVAGNPFCTSAPGSDAQQIPPDLIGYADRPAKGRFGRHVVAVYQTANVHYMIDFTAAQYGYDAWPLIQRLQGGEIHRLDNETGGWTFIGHFDAAAVAALREIAAAELHAAAA